MSKQTIWMTGITGFVGRYLATKWLQQDGVRLIGIGRSANRPDWLPEEAVYESIDLQELSGLEASIARHRPDWVIHSGAISRPNDAEANQALTKLVNVDATNAIAIACRKADSRMVFMSSDMVFGHHGPYVETDLPCPVNYYGVSKAAGEAAVIDAGIEHLIIRTVLVYGKPLQPGGATFVQWVAKNLIAGTTIQVYTDQQRTVTYVHDLVSGILALMQSSSRGVYHICGEETWTPFAMAKHIASRLGLPTELVQPVTSAERPEPALRPTASTLSIDKIKKAVGFQPTALDVALSQIFTPAH